MYLRDQVVDDLATEVIPETRLVKVFYCPVSNKMYIGLRSLIKNVIPYKLSFCCSIIYLTTFYFNAGKQTNKKVNDICDRVIFVANPTVLNDYQGETSLFPVLLSSRLIRVFDENIQSAFGILMLCKKLGYIVGEKVNGARPIIFPITSKYVAFCAQRVTSTCILCSRFSWNYRRTVV